MLKHKKRESRFQFFWPSGRRAVGPSVCRSVGPSVRHTRFQILLQIHEKNLPHDYVGVEKAISSYGHSIALWVEFVEIEGGSFIKSSKPIED